MSRRHLALRAMLAVLAALGLAIPLLVDAGPARADARSDYEAAKAQLGRLRQQSDLLVDKYNANAEKLDELNKQVRSSETRLGQVKEQVDATRTALSRQAVAVYKYGAFQAGGVAAVLQVDDVEQFPRASKYLGDIQGDTRTALAKFDAARSDLDEETKALQSAKSKQEALVTSLKGQQRQIESSLAQQEQITARFKSQVEAEERAAAERARRAAEAAAAQRAAQASAAGTGSARRAASGGGGGGGGGGGSAIAGPPSAGASSAVAFAQAQLGKPYCWGGGGPNCFDCSGLTSAAWRYGGKSIPRSSSAQHGLPRVGSPAPGDIGWRPGHVGLYVGGGQVINAPHSGAVVRYGSAGGYSSFHRP